MTLDWGIGRYEHTARELEPVAAHVVGLAQLREGERVLDIGCGTGNAALAAARAGADVTGLDRSQRLLSVAAERADAERLDVSFVLGDAQELPFEDASFDVVVSVFGIVFAADAERAFAEMVRVLRAGGRALLSAWIPEGPMNATLRVLGQAVAEATGSEQQRFAWHDRTKVGGLARRHRIDVAFHEGTLTVVAGSPEEYFADAEANHPMSIATRPVLERAGTYEDARARALAALRDGNEDPTGFLVTSPYRVVELRRSATG